jgi:archaellum component FlaC
MSAAPLDSRLAHLEGAYDQISDRLNSIDKRFEMIDKRFESIDRRFEGVERRLDDLVRRSVGLVARMDRQFFWLMGIMIVSILLPVVERFSVR